MNDERSLGRFLRGLTIGALLGAVIAGSRLWTRRSGRAPAQPAAAAPPPQIPPRT
jgi:hypothetical protein